MAVVLLSIFILTRPANGSTEELAKCIGENSELYIQLGCHACESQENLFGKNYDQITLIDCFYQREECLANQIEATPTWIIGGEKYRGVRSLEELKQLTGC